MPPSECAPFTVRTRRGDIHVSPGGVKLPTGDVLQWIDVVTFGLTEWGVVCDGRLLSLRFRLRRQAEDMATDLRSLGGAATVVEIAPE